MIDFGKAYNLADIIEAAHEAEQKFEAQVWFRGQSEYKWQLKPSVHRRHPILEAQFLHHFRLRAPSMAACPNHEDHISWLPLMQHYGLPTRLLDWTESAMIAAYFGLPKIEKGIDGAIYMLAPGKLNQISIGDIIPFLVDERVKKYIKDAFTGKSNPDNNQTISVLAPRTDKRMAVQFGNYTIHGTREPLEDNPMSSTFLGKIIIPHSARDKIKSDLSVAGIRRSNLFPDLESLAKEVSEIIAFGLNGEDLDAKK
jgi:hypothetical protein